MLDLARRAARPDQRRDLVTRYDRFDRADAIGAVDCIDHRCARLNF